MSPELIEFSNVVLRFTHIIAAIMWIGNSLLFTWMEVNLIKDPDDPKSLGHMNMLHAGGVFFLDKQVIDPNAIPERLHVFKWQSYTTWLSGFALIALTFYTKPGALLLDPSKSDMTGLTASMISLFSLVGAWFFYDFIFKSPLRKRPAVAMGVITAGFIGYAYWIDGFYSNRFVYLQLGAMLATTMSANVRFVIIPNQKKMMAALKEGKPHDLELGRQAKMRSLTNNYVTFPVIFMMLSAHFPMVYADTQYIPILIVITVGLIVIKHMMNIYNKFDDWLFVCIGTFVAGLSAVLLLMWLPDRAAASEMRAALPVSVDVIEGKAIYDAKGCAACHQPVDSTVGPTLYGIYGTERRLADGGTVIADEAYLRESILYSKEKVSRGYAPAMPGYADLFTDEEVDRLVAYIKSLK